MTQRCGLTGENVVMPAFCSSSSAAEFAAQACDQINCTCCHCCSAKLGVPSVVGLHRGMEGLAVFSGEVLGGFPDEVGDLPVGD